MRLYTIGFTKKPASRFFGILGDSGATAVVDTRLHDASQLAGFAKRDDLRYFLRELCGMGHRREPLLAPTAAALQAYRRRDLSWDAYAQQYLRLIRDRRVEEVLRPADLDGTVLLCSEATPERCHRRLAAEYLAAAWGDLEIVHL